MGADQSMQTLAEIPPPKSSKKKLYATFVILYFSPKQPLRNVLQQRSFECSFLGLIARMSQPTRMTGPTARDSTGECSRSRNGSIPPVKSREFILGGFYRNCAVQRNLRAIACNLHIYLRKISHDAYLAFLQALAMNFDIIILMYLFTEVYCSAQKCTVLYRSV